MSSGGTFPWWLRAALIAFAAPVCILLYSAAIGLGLHRHGEPWAVSLAATTAVFLPPALAAAASTRERLGAFCMAAVVWGLAGLLLLPVYFPGERRDAVTTGLTLFSGGDWEGLAKRVADTLPEEPAMATPELASAVELTRPVLPRAEPLDDHQIALPYEGEGRNLAIPVVFQHQGREVEVLMMLDTGATYTTLSDSTLSALGITPSDADPVIRLHTANGERDAHILAVEKVWLGDLALESVAIATCDQCSSKDTAGLLGLNVAGGFNVGIDADRREVTFSRRETFDRKLDIKPWLDLDATFARYPGGRVEVTVEVMNRASKPVKASAQVRCGEIRWTVDLGVIEPGVSPEIQRRLPAHEACEAYEISLHGASY